jgi:hypothetical protein
MLLIYSLYPSNLCPILRYFLSSRIRNRRRIVGNQDYQHCTQGIAQSLFPDPFLEKNIKEKERSQNVSAYFFLPIRVLFVRL